MVPYMAARITLTEECKQRSRSHRRCSNVIPPRVRHASPGHSTTSVIPHGVPDPGASRRKRDLTRLLLARHCTPPPFSGVTSSHREHFLYSEISLRPPTPPVLQSSSSPLSIPLRPNGTCAENENAHGFPLFIMSTRRTSREANVHRLRDRPLVSLLNPKLLVLPSTIQTKRAVPVPFPSPLHSSLPSPGLERD